MTSRQQRRAAERQACKDANRQNAQLSTGPRTEEGKLASSRNSFKHGLYAKQLVMPGEDPAQLDALRADLRAEHQPQTPTEDLLVNELAEQYWRLKRMRRIEATILGADDPEALQRGFALLPMVQRTMAAAERGFHKALKALHQLRKQRGFVPQTPKLMEPQTTPVGQPIVATEVRETMPLRPALGVMAAAAFQAASPLTCEAANHRTATLNEPNDTQSLAPNLVPQHMKQQAA